MQNIKSVINNHNMKVSNNTAEVEESCSCGNKNNYPLDGKYFTPNLICEAQITSNQLNYKQKIYIGTAETGLTTTQNNSTFNTIQHYENGTPFNTAKRICYLFLNEKPEIASCKGDNLLNKSEQKVRTC